MKEINRNEINNIDDPLIIDLRDYKDYKISHTENSYNVKKDNVIGFILNYSKNKNIVLTCYTGHQSKIVGNMLLKLGYKKIYLMK